MNAALTALKEGLRTFVTFVLSHARAFANRQVTGKWVMVGIGVGVVIGFVL